MPRPTQPLRLLGVLLAFAAPVVLAAGCGSSGGGDKGGESASPADPQPSASVEDFPTSSGKTLPDVVGSLPNGPTLVPSVSLLEKGKDRIGFALFDNAGKQLAGAGVALYVGKIDGSGARGPYIATSESLKVSPQFESKQTATDPNAARGVYVADVPFTKDGKFAMLAVAKLDGRVVATSPIAVKVGSTGKTPPGPGQKVPVVHTLTPTDVAGDVAKIDTRIPPAPALLKDDFADVVGKKPVVLTFATPQLCQSRVCGPVVDVVAQVQSKMGADGKVAFIHNEVYQDNEVNKGLRSQLIAFHLQTEPWTFVIDRHGVVSTRFEGAFSPDELERAVAKVEAAT
ncbi:MAG TPA: hypothetical protein VGM33_23485 [Baekduia sp.]|jgi:hypothetical protein